MVDELDQARVALPSIIARGGLTRYPRTGKYLPEGIAHDDALEIVVGTDTEVIRVRTKDRLSVWHLASDIRDEVGSGPRLSVLRRCADRQLRPPACNHIVVEALKLPCDLLRPPAPDHVRPDLAAEHSEVLAGQQRLGVEPFYITQAINWPKFRRDRRISNVRHRAYSEPDDTKGAFSLHQAAPSPTAILAPPAFRHPSTWQKHNGSVSAVGSVIRFLFMTT